ITSEASRRAREAFCSPSAAITLARASRAASASAAIALWFTAPNDTYISTRSTLMPHASVASSNESCMLPEIVIRSLRISCRCRVPIVLRSVVWASSRVE
uniref:Uncharacterized protein n=1 Tax=Anopheles atroparvus TaxID=41427 RepID=A0AAG5D473_ANOAO